MSNDDYRSVSHNLFHRMMRRNGKLYHLTLISVSLAIVASVSVSLWNFNTSEFHLWLDLIPQGFGIASMITTTLIVSIRAVISAGFYFSYPNCDYRP
jgi:ABC-type phosphate transport system permease subunit